MARPTGVRIGEKQHLSAIRSIRPAVIDAEIDESGSPRSTGKQPVDDALQDHRVTVTFRTVTSSLNETIAVFGTAAS